MACGLPGWVGAGRRAVLGKAGGCHGVENGDGVAEAASEGGPAGPGQGRQGGVGVAALDPGLDVAGPAERVVAGAGGYDRRDGDAADSGDLLGSDLPVQVAGAGV